MPTRRACLIALLLLLTCAAPARADAEEDRLRAQIARLPVVERDFFDKAKYAGRYALSDLVRYTVRGGRLEANFRLPGDLVRQFADPAPLLIAVAGSPHVWTLNRRRAGTLDEGLSLVTLSCYAPDETWPFGRYAVSSDGQGTVMASGVQMAGPRQWQQSLTLSQGGGAITIVRRLESEKYAEKRLRVADLAEFATRASAVSDANLRPILRRLGAGLPAGDVYRVFDQVPADSAVAAKIRPLVAGLDGGDPDARDAAAEALRALGRPATLACLRLNPAVLSPEQANRLASIYAADGWLHVADVEAARSDPDFLAACTEDEDERVRTAATNMLAALRAVKQMKR